MLKEMDFAFLIFLSSVVKKCSLCLNLNLNSTGHSDLQAGVKDKNLTKGKNWLWSSKFVTKF